MLYCRDCGKENPDDAKFCSNCGHLLTPQPTQGTGLRSLPEIKPENVEEIDDVPDITEVHILPKEEIKLELPKRPEIDSDGTTETNPENSVQVFEMPTPSTSDSDEISELKLDSVEDKIEAFEKANPKTDEKDEESLPAAEGKKKFPWMAVVIALIILILIVFVIIKFKK